jgi:hypothetical protein
MIRPKVWQHVDVLPFQIKIAFIGPDILILQPTNIVCPGRGAQ